MGWLWGDTSSSKDSVDQLDPDLRKYLDQEKPDPRHSQLPSTKETSYAEQLHLKGDGNSPSAAGQGIGTPQIETSGVTVPAASLYPDGRYAHLWKNYKPQQVIEGSAKTDQEQLRDMFDSYEDRKKESGRAALENCVFQQIAYSECLTGGGWYARTTLCNQEQRALNRCIEMQAKFLRALGYRSVAGRSWEDEERIQMHADKLYQRMIEQERLREEAKEKGLPDPTFPPIIAASDVDAGIALKAGGKYETPSVYKPSKEDPIDLSDLPTEKARNYFRKILRENPKWTHEQMEVEKADLKARYREDSNLAKTYNDILEERKQLAEKRFAEGRPTVGDRLQSLRKYLF